MGLEGQVQLSVLSLNCENLGDLVFADPTATLFPARHQRSTLLGALVASINADIIGLVEAAPTLERTARWFAREVGPTYDIHQAERRGVLGLALAVRASLGLTVSVKTKDESNRLYALGEYDADNDGIKEVYSWANRVPFELTLSGGALASPVTFVVIHAKSKGVFIPGDLYAFERQSQAARMKLRAQGVAVRRRLDQLVDANGRGRVIALGDMNDSAEFDIYAAKLGGAFLTDVVGSIWDPARIFTDTHHGFPPNDRWTIDYKDRVVNPITETRYGMPTDMRSWIDHILVSPELRGSVVPGSAAIAHVQPFPLGWTGPRRGRGTDHHPPSVSLDL